MGCIWIVSFATSGSWIMKKKTLKYHLKAQEMFYQYWYNTDLFV